MWMFSHLISSEALRQHPVEDVTGAARQGPVDDCRAPLVHALRDRFSVGAVSEGDLPVDDSSHLRNTNSSYNNLA